MRRSIRWELPLSYAAIALLATLALGAVLLLILRGYYLRVERDYLQSNAQAIAFSLRQVLEDDPPPEELQSHLNSLAFLSNARVELYDTTQQPVASSDPLGMVAISLASSRLGDSSGLRDRSLAVIRPGAVTSTTLSTEDGSVIWIPAEPMDRLPSLAGERRRIFPLPEGGEWPGTQDGSGDTYSSQVARVPITSDAGALLGYVELSNGPAYASEILEDVGWGWGLASIVAVAVAAVVGLIVSRRISAPLVALTEVTTFMADGDLSARADVDRRDELGTLAQSFNRMAGQVEEIVTSLRRFVSDAAHEIHTPLTALHTNLELAQRDAAPESNEHLVAARAQVERLEGLTGGLLELSRLESPVQPPQLVPVSLLPLVQEVGELYASRAEQAGVTFELSVPEAPVSVLGDEGELTRALSNLLDNALKFTPEGGQIVLGCRKEGAEAVLWVQDTGIGFPDEDLPHLFDRFYRGRNTAAYAGSGLGLAIVQAIVDRHRGQVRAESAPQGATFSVRLPAL